MNETRPQLLISVRIPEEADLALREGADIIDIKEPARGALGMADAETIDAIVARIAGRRPVSAAMGNLEEPPRGQPRGKLNYVKVGLPVTKPVRWRELLAKRFDPFPAAGAIVVLYADELSHRASRPFIQEAIAWIIRHRGAGLLLDTFDKSAGDLFACMNVERIKGTIRAAREANVPIALAGKLQEDSLRRAIALLPDIIGVRGAACVDGDRGATLDAERLRRVRSLISGSIGLQVPPAKANAGD